MDERDGKSAGGLARRPRESLDHRLGRQTTASRQQSVQLVANKMREDFGVRLGQEFVAATSQVLSQRSMVFDDAVVDESELARLVQMGVGIDIIGQAVRGPACVADASGAGDRFLLEQLLQSGNAANTFAQLQRTAIHE